MKLLKLLFLLLLPVACFAQDLRPSAYLGAPGKVTVRGGKILGTSGGVTTIAETTINPANSATTSVYIDLSSTPTLSTSTTGFPASNFFPICVVIKDANGVITSFTDSRPDSFMAGGGISPNSPVPQAQVGPGFNVKNYGAKGDSQATGSSACTFVATNAQFTCTGTAFSAATDIGKNLFCNSTNAGASFFGNSLQTIVSVQGAGTATASTTSGFSAAGACVWGTIDDAAISAAVTAAKAASKGVNNTGNTGIFTATPRLYFPAGGYLACTTLLNGMVVLGTAIDGFILEGDGADVSILYPGAGNACPLTNNNSLGSFVQVASGANNVQIRNLTFDGVNNTSTSSNALSLNGSNTHISDVVVQRWGGSSQAALNVGGSIVMERVVSVVNQGTGIICNGCGGDFNTIGSSNNGGSGNLVIQNVIGSATGGGLRLRGSTLIDECGDTGGCTKIINSPDVWFEGPSLFGTPNGFCINVDANSFLHWIGGICGTFNNDTVTGGPRIAAGGTLLMSDVRSIGSGTGKCITNNGTLLDNGGNSCESMFGITSGTSTGTTAVLTVTNLGAAPNVNCTAGDSIIVQGSGLAGYNGYFPFAITAVGATTITYTTTASNVGALGAGGTAYCRNLQTYSGNLPRALLNNPVPNTCVLSITPIVNATTYQLCEWSAGSATNINRIRAGSQNVTACATAPIITISDGTVSQTLTLTTAKSTWDSAVDASTGVGTTIFKPGGTITVKYDAGALSACATPPTNFRVSYNITPILSN